MTRLSRPAESKPTSWSLRAFALAWLASLAMLASSPGATAQSAPADFLEEFAFAADPDARARALEKLIPGTEDSYFYHALHHQHTGSLDQVPALLKAWSKRYGRTQRLVEIEHRQALLSYGDDPAATFGYLRRVLNLRFTAQRDKPKGAPSKLPTRLDPVLLSTQRLDANALATHPRSLNGFRTEAIRRLASESLDQALLRSLLQRLDRPDVPNLPALIARDLRARNSGKFGSHPIHGRLLLAQLDELASLRPELLSDRGFIDVYIRRLAPSEDVRVEHDATAREAWLTRLQSFADRLPPSQNSLKANVLFHRLEHDLALGKPDAERLFAYLRLPRNVNYRNPAHFRQAQRGSAVQFGGQHVPGLPALTDDSELLRHYLEHFLRDADNFEPFARFVRRDFLERVFAETKILAGIGDMERWYSMLDDPSYYEQLERRVEIDFAPTQRSEFRLDEKVAVELDIKNVETLLIKVFEIDSYAYHCEFGADPNVGIDLDGLVAGSETTRNFDAPALRRVRRTFDFPEIRGPGCWVIEFLGNGISSRALIQRGRLHAVGRVTAAGHLIRVYDQHGNHTKTASAWLDGREYQPDQGGEIVVPFTAETQTKPIVLRDGRLSAIDRFTHRGESYELTIGAFAPRESLITGALARVIVRPHLALGQTQMPIALLENTSLEIVATDSDGVRSVQTVRDLELRDDAEYVHEFRVPDRCALIEVGLGGQVKRARDHETVTLLTRHQQFSVNAIDQTAASASSLLSRTDRGDYVLEILGKCGELKAGRPVKLSLQHRDYVRPVEVVLQTDENGRIRLGALTGIVSLATDAIAESRWSRFDLSSPVQTYPRQLHGAAGGTVRLPWAGSSNRPTRDELSLLELRERHPVRDAFAALVVDNGYLELRDLEPGDYALRLHREQLTIPVRITDGELRSGEGLAVGSDRILPQNTPETDLQIVSFGEVGDQLVVQLAGISKETRVHLYSTRYLPAYDALDHMRVRPEPGPIAAIDIEPARGELHAGRVIGDEYRYILDRRFAPKFAGNMLRRPGLLLNPWELDEAATVGADARGLGGGAGGRRGARSGGPTTSGSAATALALSPSAFANLDFMPRPAVLLSNRRPGKDGSIKIPLARLGAFRHLIHVVAIDGTRTLSRVHRRTPKAMTPRTRQLLIGLDLKKNFTEQKRVEFVAADSTTTIEDVTSSQVQTYDSLESVYTLFAALGNDTELAKFAFVLRWPELSDAEKWTMYSEHACHELHYFLFRKDREFFDAVVQPYLANKAHKKFLDEWLLDLDLSRYVENWAFGQLNLFEKILLAQRLSDTDRTSATTRHLREALELMPEDTNWRARLFATALQSGALDSTRGPADEVPASNAPRSSNESKDVAARRPAAVEEPEADDGELASAFSRDFDGGKSREHRRKRDLGRRGETRQLYRHPNRTRQLVESDYWHRRIEETDAGLIRVNQFWCDFAAAKVGEPFCSVHFPQVGSDAFAAKLLALAALDLPFRATKDGVTRTRAGNRVEIRSTQPLLLVRKELLPAEQAQPNSGGQILISQNFFRLDDRYRFDGNQRRDKFVREEFLIDLGYGCQVVLTNPSSSPREFELLTQIPTGSTPVLGAHPTRGQTIQLAPFSTSTVEFAFYFPRAGSYSCYPAHVSEDGRAVAAADAISGLRVVTEPTKIDTTSWDHVSQYGTEQEVLAYLDSHNLARINFGRIAWRLKSKPFFGALTKQLSARFHFDQTVWSYGLLHRDPATTSDFLENRGDFLAQCGTALESPLIDIDPIERRAYQHMEFDPLFHARAHPFGEEQILNRRLARQYASFLRMSSYRPRLDDIDWMTATYYLLLEDRVGDAMKTFARVDAKRLPTRLQHDYMTAYLAFFEVDGDRRTARRLAEQHAEHPVDRWRTMFRDVLAQLDEIEGQAPEIVGDGTDRTNTQTVLAASEPALELEVESRRITLRHANLDNVQLRYYAMDAELSFSKTPFVQQNGSGTGAFGYVQPNRSDPIALMDHETTFDLPAEFANQNVLIEASGGGLRRRQTYFATSLDVRMIENYGQLRVADVADDKPLPMVYVKVYARLPGGSVVFHKDGYTDLRGRFDYASVSAENTRNAERFAILVLSEERGAAIREVAPPAN